MDPSSPGDLANEPAKQEKFMSAYAIRKKLDMIRAISFRFPAVEKQLYMLQTSHTSADSTLLQIVTYVHTMIKEPNLMVAGRSLMIATAFLVIFLV